jgi:HEAT repeat protein
VIIDEDLPMVLRQRAVAIVALCGEAGSSALLRQLLQRTEPEIRRAAIAGVARGDPEQSVPALERMLKDDNVHVRVAAVHALGWQDSRQAETPLLTALIGPDDALRTAAAQALALDGESGWQILKEAATDPEAAVRRAATHGLALLNDFWVVQLLAGLEQEDEVWAVRVAATEALDRIARRNRRNPWEPLEVEALPWLAEWTAQQREEESGDRVELADLCRALTEAEEVPVRLVAAQTLAELYLTQDQRHQVREALLRVVENDADARVREQAYATLAEFNRAELN